MDVTVFVSAWTLFVALIIDSEATEWGRRRRRRGNDGVLM